jgi:FKBP-type peptidyl-prolyl cis-trans isomerase FkpA
MFKKIISGLIVTSVVIVSCTKNNNRCGYSESSVIAPTAEMIALNDSLHTHGINNAIANDTGFYYVIENPGSGTGISNLCTIVSVSYKGTYFNDSTFDSTAANQLATFQLGQVIVGWQKGLPLISKGGEITLYIPPSLAYGVNPVLDNSGNILIPANSFLKFDIHLVDIQ